MSYTKETILTQISRDIARQEGAVNPGIFQTSTVLFETIEQYHAAEKGDFAYPSMKDASTLDPSYGIAGTSTNFALQKALAVLENGSDAMLLPSGLSSITTTLQALLSAGDHALIVDSVYGPTRRYCNKELKRFGVEVTYYDPRGDVAGLIQENTKLVMMEAPGSQTFEIQDIDAVIAVAKANDLYTVFDNSWATPLLFNPLDHGVDVVVHALTKYISGHSDVVMGAAITADKKIAHKIMRCIKNNGIAVSAHDCWLVLRGLRSLAPRLARHAESAMKVAEFLKSRDEISHTLFPALKSSPDYELFKKYFKGHNSLMSVVFDKSYSKEQIYKFINTLKLFGKGASWGGYESLVLDFDPNAGSRTATTWNHEGVCVRFYVGLENAADLIADIEGALMMLA